MKDFIVLAPVSSVKYNNVFPLIKEGKIWVSEGRGVSPTTGKEYKGRDGIYFYGGGEIYLCPAKWLTTIKWKEHSFTPTKEYVPEKYPLLDNYDAIEVSRVKDMPADYKGVMAVPISILFVYNPNEFEVLESISNASLNGKVLYNRIFIRRK